MASLWPRKCVFCDEIVRVAELGECCRALEWRCIAGIEQTRGCGVDSHACTCLMSACPLMACTACSPLHTGCREIFVFGAFV